MPNTDDAIHVLPDGDRWAVKREGQDAPLSTHDTQEEAAEAGRAEARSAEVEFQLHAADGTIREKDSYGNDPRDIPG
ncbi:MAG: DUF2188 domain-containing protein [Actinobacteria bacterium]|nr:DUF2188 domain-containing protein [Actinomycetota bacterium]